MCEAALGGGRVGYSRGGKPLQFWRAGDGRLKGRRFGRNPSGGILGCGRGAHKNPCKFARCWRGRWRRRYLKFRFRRRWWRRCWRRGSGRSRGCVPTRLHSLKHLGELAGPGCWRWRRERLYGALFRGLPRRGGGGGGFERAQKHSCCAERFVLALGSLSGVEIVLSHTEDDPLQVAAALFARLHALDSCVKG